MKIIIPLLVISLIFNLFLVVLFRDEYKTNDWLKDENNKISDRNYINESRYNECKNQTEQFSKFQSIIDEVGQIPYKSSGANCYDHSKLLQKKLAENDITSSIFINKGRTHAWVAVWLEVTKGNLGFSSNFIPVKNPYEVLEVRDSKLNVICSK